MQHGVNRTAVVECRQILFRRIEQPAHLRLNASHRVGFTRGGRSDLREQSVAVPLALADTLAQGRDGIGVRDLIASEQAHQPLDLRIGGADLCAKLIGAARGRFHLLACHRRRLADNALGVPKYLAERLRDAAKQFKFGNKRAVRTGARAPVHALLASPAEGILLATVGAAGAAEDAAALGAVEQARERLGSLAHNSGRLSAGYEVVHAMPQIVFDDSQRRIEDFDVAMSPNTAIQRQAQECPHSARRPVRRLARPKPSVYQQVRHLPQRHIVARVGIKGDAHRFGLVRINDDAHSFAAVSKRCCAALPHALLEGFDLAEPAALTEFAAEVLGDDQVDAAHKRVFALGGAHNAYAAGLKDFDEAVCLGVAAKSVELVDVEFVEHTRRRFGHESVELRAIHCRAADGAVDVLNCPGTGELTALLNLHFDRRSAVLIVA